MQVIKYWVIVIEVKRAKTTHMGKVLFSVTPRSFLYSQFDLYFSFTPPLCKPKRKKILDNR